MNEHRDKAVEAAMAVNSATAKAVRQRFGAPRVEAFVDAIFEAADQDLQRMYSERFKEVVLSEEAVEAVIRRRHPRISLQTLAFKKEVVDDACSDLEAALSKAQQLMEEGG